MFSNACYRPLLEQVLCRPRPTIADFIRRATETSVSSAQGVASGEWHISSGEPVDFVCYGGDAAPGAGCESVRTILTNGC